MRHSQLRGGTPGGHGFTRSDLFARLADQGLWSAGSFAFNLVGASVLAVTEYASLTVCASIGVIVAAAVRAYAVDGRVIAGARNSLSGQDSLTRKSVLMPGLAGALGAGLFSLMWLVAGNSLTNWWQPLVAVAIVLADGPHYTATMYGLFRRAAYVAFVYALLAGAVLVLSSQHVPFPLVLIWVTSLGAVWAMGWNAIRPIPWTATPIATMGVPLRLSGEAMYSALGAQLGILVIFLTSPPDDTAGIRLAYSLVFAPVFMLIQGFSPLFLSRMAQLHSLGGPAQLQLLRMWLSVWAAGIVLSGAAGAVLSTFWHNSNFEKVVPFLIPVGAAMLGSLLLDSALLPLRFSVAPQLPHRIRLGVVAAEAALQFALALTWGTGGLVAALMIGFSAKLLLSCLLAVRVWRSRDLSVDEVHLQRRSAVS
ncbi:hypothetical protein E7Y32_08490 [Arthrobacter sp. UKPF54-2]|uniref:hypothetical protein n=1 Tax=Arthrobacter sp. UKPF54-2 TaxID=2600159 RepID=UPI0011B11D36|nr:hypothetical protein [Arthrobacter sp. UKPF54-2]QDY90240.1 hypothetical protein E7Y32_08490 [Arthrobacter sp. UKPF54-2]